jgi:hypothetical protein
MSNESFNQLANPVAPGARLGALSADRVLILVGAGVVSACAIAFLQTPLRIPGHAIFKAGLPIAGGIALVSRPLAGTVASASGMFTAAIFMLVGIGHLSAAAMVPLIAFGPAADLARKNANDRWSILLRLGLAGLGVNLLAFSVRWSGAFFQNDLLHSLSFRQFIATALVSFALCGLGAGGIAGVIYACRRGDSEISP